MIKELLLITTLMVPAMQPQNNAKPSAVLFESVFESTDGSGKIHGETIDGQGHVHAFNNEIGGDTLKFRDWNLGIIFSKTEYWEMTQEEAEKNLSMTDSVVCTINTDTLAKYVHLFSLLIQKKSDFQSMYASFRTTHGWATRIGTTSLYGFIYDKDKNKYIRILIEEHGDIDSRNPSVHVTAFRNWKWCK